MTESSDKYLEELIRYSEKTRGLFSNAQKSEREKMVCRGFLRCIDVQFQAREILVGATEPVDISFRSAAFQITEVLDEGRRRNDELREREEKYRKARSVEDVMELQGPSSEPLSFADMSSRVADRLNEKFCALGGPRGCHGVDALVYVNLIGRHLWPAEFDSKCAGLSRVRSQGWRSVSVLMLPYGVVFFGTDDAPEFLRDIQGTISHDENRIDGWFDP